tara:strand:- start:16 stop:564 length:549 start_codon:yes stop_codon:yes gene_type:complete
MKKIVAASAVVLGLGLTGLAFAGGDTPVAASSPSGLGVSFNFSTINEDQAFLGLDYRTNGFEGGVMANSEWGDWHSDAEATSNHTDVQAYLGMVRPMSSHVDVSFGAQGDFRWYSDDAGKDYHPWEAGLYAGMNYNPTAHFSIMNRLSLVSYKAYNTDGKNGKQKGAIYAAFNATIGCAYFF